MRNLAGGVSVISAGSGEYRSGLTATSVSSLSLDPPSLLVCIQRASATLAAITAHRAFGVNVLSAHHRDLADRFAGRSGIWGAARYVDTDWLTLATGAPLLADALAAADCTLEKVIEWNSHAIVIGRVRAVRVGSGQGPLVYWQGKYEQVSDAGHELLSYCRYQTPDDPDNY
jgi:flavin reductase (DIM6/NTAB) family NADH-FMN oxidoreductase RutF